MMSDLLAAVATKRVLVESFMVLFIYHRQRRKDHDVLMSTMKLRSKGNSVCTL